MTLIRMNKLILEVPSVAQPKESSQAESREALMRLIRSLLSDSPPPVTWAGRLFSSTQGFVALPAFWEDVAAAGND